MFSFGIFTTHIPYIAFVVFYAYFIVFGVNKASNGKLHFVENNNKIELQFSAHSCDDLTHSYFEYSNTNYSLHQTSYRSIILKQKIPHPQTFPHVFKSEISFKSLFSRPPPVLT